MTSDRDEYAERAAGECWSRLSIAIETAHKHDDFDSEAEAIIAEAYAPLHEKISRANGMIETMNESMKRLESELAQTASDRDEWRRLAESYDGDRVGAQQELARVTEERDQWKAQSKRHEKALDEAYKELEGVPELIEERDCALRFLSRRGYKHCDIPACNCDSWHGGDFETRFREIADLLDTNGKTPLDAVRELIEERDRLREQIEDRDWARDKD